MCTDYFCTTLYINIYNCNVQVLEIKQMDDIFFLDIVNCVLVNGSTPTPYFHKSNDLYRHVLCKGTVQYKQAER